ncbi:hypothetical protein SteCoe_10511 [Stentor coeruleus]|uniref:Uncharacterized protein n=1 Tax=Stentor coeruleus TaxID=5963 RepID=A0A1R2CFH7_9CILI|nr:hypothetical protein SteCoe_10511 [Stentor coeruleus]
MQNETQQASEEYCCIKITVLHTPPGEKNDFVSNVQTLTSIKCDLNPGLDIENKLSNQFLESKCKLLLDDDKTVQKEYRFNQTLSLPNSNSYDKVNINTNRHSFNISPQIQMALTIKNPEKIDSGSCSCCVF